MTTHRRAASGDRNALPSRRSTGRVSKDSSPAHRHPASPSRSSPGSRRISSHASRGPSTCPGKKLHPPEPPPGEITSGAGSPEPTPGRVESPREGVELRVGQIGNCCDLGEAPLDHGDSWWMWVQARIGGIHRCLDVSWWAGLNPVLGTAHDSMAC